EAFNQFRIHNQGAFKKIETNPDMKDVGDVPAAATASEKSSSQAADTDSAAWTPAQQLCASLCIVSAELRGGAFDWLHTLQLYIRRRNCAAALTSTSNRPRETQVHRACSSIRASWGYVRNAQVRVVPTFERRFSKRRKVKRRESPVFFQFRGKPQ
ncbi:unnamed protein product, partial [Rangifer tarandus platyrhynchus]